MSVKVKAHFDVPESQNAMEDSIEYISVEGNRLQIKGTAEAYGTGGTVPFNAIVALKPDQVAAIKTFLGSGS